MWKFLKKLFRPLIEGGKESAEQDLKRNEKEFHELNAHTKTSHKSRKPLVRSRGNSTRKVSSNSKTVVTPSVRRVSASVPQPKLESNSDSSSSDFMTGGAAIESVIDSSSSSNYDSGSSSSPDISSGGGGDFSGGGASGDW